ncbi:MAG: hypothetical protein KF699_16270 [Phycisphaeraceae bacterium]|nr:hypothetical protein [Phycisphaeraceae bacterium]
MHKVRRLVEGGVLLSFLFACAAGGQVAHSFTPLGELPGGAFSSRASGVSANGRVIVGRSNNGAEVAVVWMLGESGWVGPVMLPSLAAGATAEARACDNAATTAFGDANNASGFRQPVSWCITPACPSPIPMPYPAMGYSGVVYSCSADGGVACGEFLENQIGFPPPLPITRAFRWTPDGGMVSLGTIPGVVAGPGHQTIARACSSDGSVIVGNANDAMFANRPWRWTEAGGMVDISAAEWSGIARGVSPDGHTVVGSFTEFGLSKPFLWSADGGRTDLEIPPGFDSGGSFAVTDGGRRAVGLCLFGGSGNTAMLWNAGAPAISIRAALLNGGVSMSLWHLQSATAMSDDGTVIVGFGINPDGQQEAWVATIPMPCAADFDGNGTREVGDIFAFLAAWFAGDPAAYAFGGTPGVPAIFAFLTAWFAGCP